MFKMNPTPSPLEARIARLRSKPIMPRKPASLQIAERSLRSARAGLDAARAAITARAQAVQGNDAPFGALDEAQAEADAAATVVSNARRALDEQRAAFLPAVHAAMGAHRDEAANLLHDLLNLLDEAIDPLAQARAAAAESGVPATRLYEASQALAASVRAMRFAISEATS
jgi:hypothetical protein